ncbi:MAG: hypothetical protein UR72_C0005G0005 [Parcubacteria group bacterium GW2011_GWC1_35_21]|nr:MAG: hypothetical protein UR72_C0005G0005 [Parcubacteria group bacterium GW2011_GWC1_35_21]
MKELKAKREAAREALGAKREEVKEEIEKKREEIKLKREEIKTEIEIKREELKQKMRVFDNVIARLNLLKEKVSAQIIKLEAKGVDTIEAESLTAEAETKLDAAKAKIIEINALLAVSTNEISAENKTKLKTLRDETQVLIKDARNALKDAIKSLRDAVKAKREAMKSETTETNETENETTN